MKKLSQNESIAVVVTLVVVFGLLFYGNKIFQNSAPTTDNQNLEVMDGPMVKAGDQISVNYVGMLADGTKFDSSYDRGEPITFTVGEGQLIKGFDDGVLGMKVGEKKRLTIPPELGYGDKAAGPIPANSTITFDVELVKIGE